MQRLGAEVKKSQEKPHRTHSGTSVAPGSQPPALTEHTQDQVPWGLCNANEGSSPHSVPHLGGHTDNCI